MTEEREYDVVVVGSGGGAMTGAFLAQRAGLSTVVIEKTSLIGGTSAYSGGACWLPGSPVRHARPASRARAGRPRPRRAAPPPVGPAPGGARGGRRPPGQGGRPPARC